MQTQALDELDGALDRVARRLAESQPPVSDAARRVRRLEREPWLGLAWTAALVAGSLYVGNYLLASGLLVMALPYKIQKVRRRRDELDFLNSSGDLLALEVESLDQRHSRLGHRAAFALWFGALFLLVGAFSPRPVVGFAAGATAFLYALVLLQWLRPRLRRALADLGAEADDPWIQHHLFVIFVLFFPLFMLVAFVRSKLGAGEQDDEADDASEESSVDGPLSDAAPADTRAEPGSVEEEPR